MSAPAATRQPASPGAGGRRARPQPLAGTGTLIRFALRRDRLRIPVWLVAIAGFTALSAASLPDVYANAAERQARAELIGNPGTAALTGPGYGLEDYTFGAMVANELLSWVAIFVALMSLLLVVRHTRAEEETGRAELVRAGVVGRHAQTVAALVVVGGANLVLGALLALSLGGAGIEDVGWAGSWLFGAAVAAVGLVFTAVAAVAAQLSTHGRGAGGLAGAAFAVAYLLRAAGDMSAVAGGTAALSWLSPVGWAQQTRVYVADRWWPLALSVALTAVLVTLAFRLSSRRDVGGGMLGVRPGPATAGPLLSGPLGLAWRQHRASLTWWSLAVFLFALGYGTLVTEVESFAEDNAAIQEWVGEAAGGALIDNFLGVLIMIWATAVAVFATLAVLRPRAEETAGRAEPLLSTAVSRSRWAGAHLVVALAGSAWLLALSALGLGLTASSALGEPDLLPRVLGAALAYVPAVWLVVGLGAVLFGVVPRASLLVWLVIAYSAVVVNFAPLLGLPDWVLDLSPFGHVPMLPAEEMRWAPLVVLTALAAGLVALGLVGFRRRDLETK